MKDQHFLDFLNTPEEEEEEEEEDRGVEEQKSADIDVHAARSIIGYASFDLCQQNRIKKSSGQRGPLKSQPLFLHTKNQNWRRKRKK